MTRKISVDVAIIGAGSAGLSAFKEASKFTNKIVLIDHGPLGTTCARIGCMPSKALIQVADYFYSRTHFDEMGIQGGNKLKIDLPAVMKHVRKLRNSFTAGTIKFTKSLGKQFISGVAEFCEPTILSVNHQQIVAKNIIIATGTSPKIPEEWRLFKNQILTDQNIFEAKTFQKKIAVIGAGAIGLELGQALCRLGIEINMFHAHDFIGGLSDPIVNAAAIKILKEEFPLYLNQKATVEKDKQWLKVKSNKHIFKANQVLAALGQEPNVAKLNLANVGVKLDKLGVPLYDKTSLKVEGYPIYIAGDVGKFRPLLHEAADSGSISGFNATQDKPECFKRRTPLFITFCDPNIAMVGQSFKDLQDTDFVIGEVHFKNQGRSRIMLQNKGVLRIYADSQSGLLLGAEMIAPAGEHLAHLIGFAIQKNMTVFDFLQMPIYHPVVEEGLRTALREIESQIKTKQSYFQLALCDSEAVSGLS